MIVRLGKRGGRVLPRFGWNLNWTLHTPSPWKSIWFHTLHCIRKKSHDTFYLEKFRVCSIDSMNFLCRNIFYFHIQNPRGGGNYPHYPSRKTANGRLCIMKNGNFRKFYFAFAHYRPINWRKSFNRNLLNKYYNGINGIKVPSKFSRAILTKWINK